MSRCQFKLIESDAKVELVLSGLIDETFPTAEIKISPTKELVVLLGEVKTINSLGIREWIKFMQKLPNEKINFLNCPKIFIDQINAVQGFIPAKSKVLSFFVPYFNEDTEAEKSFLFTYEKDYGTDFINIPQTIPDPAGGTFGMDVIGNKYFKFLKAPAA